MAKSPGKTKRLINWLRTSVYAFPLLIIVVLLLLTALSINGSSTGIYYSLTHGTEESALIYGHPRPIRSDEWLGTSPLTELQYKTGFPQFNRAISGGTDVAITPDLPAKNWVTFFRPQNCSFFILPFENAFAFRWWFGLALLTISAYFFILRLLHSKKLGILFSIAFALSPFLLWWYQSDLFIPMAYSFLMMIIAIRIIGQERIPWLKSARTSNILYILALAYLGVSLVLFLYAPFIISVFLVAVAFALGYLLNERLTKKSITTRQSLQRLGLMLAPLLVIAPIILLFASEHKDMIHAIANSAYPGHRITESGQLPFSRLYRFFDGFLMPLLQHPPTGHFYTNQSEAADFILLLPFLLVPGIALQVYDYWKNKRLDWTFLLIQLLAILFVLRITVPVGNGFYRLLLLDRVPNNRLMAGVGLAGFLQLIYFVKHLQQVKIPKRILLTAATAYSLLIFAWLLVFSKFFFYQYLAFKHNRLVVGSLALLFTAIIFAFLIRKRLWGAVLLLVFTVGSSFYILPLQRGQPFLDSSRIIKEIQKDSGPNDTWAVVDNFTFTTLPMAAGRPELNGPQLYAHLDLWGQLDKNGRFKSIYNREAHALFISDNAESNEFLSPLFARKMSQDLELVKGNVFKIRFSCSEFVYKNVNFVLTTHKLDMPCANLVDSAVYPKVTFYIYKITPPATQQASVSKA